MSDIWYHIREWLSGTYTLRILENSCELLLKIGPALFLSLCISVVATRLMRKRHFSFSSRNELIAVLIAALLGLVSPLPTYAAIPVALSLMPGGVPFSAVLAFSISSPLMNPSVFFLTATQLGMEMAVARTLTALILGLAGGLSVMTVFKAIPAAGVGIPEKSGFRDSTLLMDMGKALRYAGKYFSIAILLSAAVKALIRPEMIADLLGSQARMGTLLAIALGVPFYSCGGAAVPFMETLMNMGMSKGATLAFFVAGPATKVETLYAFRTMLGTKVLLLYLALTLVVAYLAGLAYSNF